ncbi:hypothetical protein GLP21_12120 [Photobacterium carnosum]|uniref:Metal-dependent hydrolase n=1 Tax=Photobacterium carnosum TaxID=2023717 RepID=A0A2N4UW34_9GAMM|nr:MULTISPECIES: metal-dependent hydrolase [Photobacterium]MCD9475812.1 hypothetical protein [Photobacterium phosphoreum]MCD9485862.1 hypothetical protein [Photobacterium iliopiscarium]MCD9507673.1 hypothetical protein [Photobacterium phosphoreum]MCD9538206.1 hypothetical protein [Photobacterium carnosum]MCD9543010.1 hypothetical protein [Photobacterium carnosum]
MLGRNHIIFGCTGWLVASKLIPNYVPDIQTTTGAFSFAFVAIGSLLPDVDCPNSIIGRKLPRVSKLLASMQGDLSHGQAFRHSRGITHTVWVWLVAYMLFLNLNCSIVSVSIMVLAVTFGACSHLLGDAFTTSGVRLFWPIPLRIRTPFYFNTGTISEYLMTYSLSLLGVLYYLGFI